MRLVIRLALPLAALTLAACTTTHSSNNQDKNTNWLMACETSATCGEGLECVCGVCTTQCVRDAQCSHLGGEAVCGALSLGGECSPEALGSNVCTLACSDNAACEALSGDLMCAGSECVLAPRLGNVQDAMVEDDASIADAAPDAPIESDADVQVDEIIASCGAGFECSRTVASPGRVEDIAADGDGNVYWADWGSLDALDNHRQDGAIKRAPKAGGDVEVLFGDLERPVRLWLDTQRYYWLRGNPIELLGGGGQQTLFEAYRDPSMAPILDEDAGLPPGEDAGVGPADPMWVRTGRFANPAITGGRFYWQEPLPGATPGLYVNYVELDAAGQSPVPHYSIAGNDYVFAGADDDAVYVENGTSIVRITPFDEQGGQVLDEILTDPVAFLVTVGSDALWLIHTGEDDRDWVASMPKTGGTIKHSGSAKDYYDRPQPGDTLVWLVTGVPNGSAWQLWSMPKTGGMRSLAFTFPTASGTVREDAPPPIWRADGDAAWVFAYGSLVRVRSR